MKRLLVTGGAGFIGQHLIKAALEAGWFVRSFDLVETREIVHPSLEYIQGDEYVEVTPKSLRLRKVYLDENQRKRLTGK